MYTKVFRSMYEGTLADSWQAMVTFQQMLILANEDGVVDMTASSIHRTTGIPLDILMMGIAVLEAPDAGSRTPEMEGRRIARLDAHRDWGWFLVNFAKYKKILSREDKKESDRVRIASKRAEKSDEEPSFVADCRAVSHGVANVAHTDTDTDTDLRALSNPNGLEVGICDSNPDGFGDCEMAKDDASEKDGVAPPERNPCPQQRIVELYHTALPELPRVEKLTKARSGYVRQRWMEDLPTISAWQNYFDDVKQSKFLMGLAQGRDGKPPFRADFEWLVRPGNFAKVSEGKYHR